MSAYHDAVIAYLADEGTELRAERDTYRELAQQAIHALTDETRRHDLTRDELTRVCDEAQRLRAHLLTKAA